MNDLAARVSQSAPPEDVVGELGGAAGDDISKEPEPNSPEPDPDSGESGDGGGAGGGRAGSADSAEDPTLEAVIVALEPLLRLSSFKSSSHTLTADPAPEQGQLTMFAITLLWLS